MISTSGNDGQSNDHIPYDPANLTHVLSVGATNSNDQPAKFSNFGVMVDIWAPGEGILTTELNDSYTQNVFGTSHAAPLVSGVAALIFDVHPDWDPDQVAMQIRVTGDPIENGSPLFYRRLNAGRALTINQDLQSNNPNNLPGVGIRASRFANSSDDTLRGREQKVTIELTLQNYLAPTKDLTIESYPNGELTADPVEVGELGTMESRTVMLDVRLDPEADFLFSEGDRQLILRLGDGEYEDFVTLFVPTELPGWKQQQYGEIPDSTSQYFGVDIAAVTPYLAWTLVNTTSLSAAQIPLYSHTVNENEWLDFQEITVLGQGQLRAPLFTITGINARTAWAGTWGRTSPSSNIQGFILRTTNGGFTWDFLNVGEITAYVNGIHFWNFKEGIFLGGALNGFWGIGLTDDGGETWQPLPQPVATLNPEEGGWTNAFSVQGDYLWFGTNHNRIWRSTDRGRSWTPHATPGRHSLEIAFTDNLNGMSLFRPIQGEGNRGLAVTDNGGVTWRNAPLPFPEADPQSVVGVPIPTGSRFFLATQRGVFQTTDFGESWEQMAMPMVEFDRTLLSAQVDPRTQEIGIYGTNVLAELMVYRETAPPASVRFDIKRQAGLVQVHSLWFSDNKETGLLKLGLEQRTTPSIKLYNSRGINVLTLHDTELEAGEHHINFDIRSLPSGNYFLRVEAEGEGVVQPIMIVR